MTSTEDLRREYTAGGLDVSDVDPDPLRQFGIWFEQVRQAGVVEPNAMVLSTVDRDGWPKSRIVLLKDADERGFRFFTNYESDKGRALAVEPRCALLFPWHALERQVKVVGVAEQLPAEESDRYFATRPRGSQLGAWASAQSTVIAERAVLERQLAEAEQRFEGRDVERPDHWGGYRVVPRVVELWQGRPSRLHDRVRYRLQHGRWHIERVSP